MRSAIACLLAVAAAQSKYRNWADVSGDALPASDAYQSVFDDIATNSAYELARHPGIVTADDYVLEAWRIMNPQVDAASTPNDGAPVLLAHGLGESGTSWFSNGDDSIAYQLADAGYDVWVLNDRSTTVSSEPHLTLDYEGLDYWSYSFVEIGDNDIPAVLDYISDETSEAKVTLVAYSQGTTATFASMADSLKDFYDARLQSYVALAPVVRMKYVWRALRYVAYYTYTIQEFIEGKEWTHIDSNGDIIQDDGTPYVFPEYSWWDYYYGNVDYTLEYIAEWLADWYEECYTGISYYYDNARTYESDASIPLKSLIHYSQNIKGRDFDQYNYIEDAENIIAYGTAEVPEIPIENVSTTPLMLVSAHRDRLATDYDIEWLYDLLLPNYAGDADAEIILVNIDGKHATHL